MVRPALLYGSECWAIRKKEERKVETTETRLLRRTAGVTLRDRKRNSAIREQFGVTPINLKMRESRMRWWGHVMRREENHLCRRVGRKTVVGRRKVGRPKKTLLNTYRDDMKALDLNTEDIMDRKKWRMCCRIADPTAGNTA